MSIYAAVKKNGDEIRINECSSLKGVKIIYKDWMSVPEYSSILIIC